MPYDVEATLFPEIDVYQNNVWSQFPGESNRFRARRSIHHQHPVALENVTGRLEKVDAVVDDWYA